MEINQDSHQFFYLRRSDSGSLKEPSRSCSNPGIQQDSKRFDDSTSDVKNVKEGMLVGDTEITEMQQDAT